jgi:hypothetical protein
MLVEFFQRNREDPEFLPTLSRDFGCIPSDPTFNSRESNMVKPKHLRLNMDTLFGNFPKPDLFQHQCLGRHPVTRSYYYESNYHRFQRLLTLLSYDEDSMLHAYDIGSIWLTSDLLFMVVEEWYTRVIQVFERSTMSSLGFSATEQAFTDSIVTGKRCWDQCDSARLRDASYLQECLYQYTLVIAFVGGCHFNSWIRELQTLDQIDIEGDRCEYEDVLIFHRLSRKRYPNAKWLDEELNLSLHSIRAYINLWYGDKTDTGVRAEQAPSEQVAVDALVQMTEDASEHSAKHEGRSVRYRRAQYVSYNEEFMADHAFEMTPPKIIPPASLKLQHPLDDPNGPLSLRDSYGTAHGVIEISPIEGAGLGSFARHDCPPKTFIGFYLSSLHPPIDVPPHDRYAYTVPSLGVYKNAWDTKHGYACCHTAYINDPLNPLKNNVCFVVDKNRNVRVYTTVFVAKGSEFLFGYGPPYWLDDPTPYPEPLMEKVRLCYGHGTQPKGESTEVSEIEWEEEPETPQPPSIEKVQLMPPTSGPDRYVASMIREQGTVDPDVPHIGETGQQNKKKRKRSKGDQVRSKGRLEKRNASKFSSAGHWKAILDKILPILSRQDNPFGTTSWRGYILTCTTMMTADTDSTDTSDIIQSMLREGQLKTLTDEQLRQDWIHYERFHGTPSQKLQQVIEQRTLPIRMDSGGPVPTGRLSEEELRFTYRSLTREITPYWSFLDGVIRLLKEGQHAIQLPNWKPNGGLGCKMDSSRNQKYSYLLHHDLACLYEEGKVVILPLQECRNANIMHFFHVNPVVIAPKPLKLSRVCLHLSYSSTYQGQIYPSYNEGVDIAVAHSQHFPQDPLPTLKDLCTMIGGQRRYWSGLYPELESLDGFTVDMASAFKQFAATWDKACLSTYSITISNVAYLVVVTSGAFGDRLAGDAYNLIAHSVDHLHNQRMPEMIDPLTGHRLRHSTYYVDDGIGVAPHINIHSISGDFPRLGHLSAPPLLPPCPICPRRDDGLDRCSCAECVLPGTFLEEGEQIPMVMESQRWYRHGLEEFRGAGCSADDKAKIFRKSLFAIGWEFNLRFDKWYVIPQSKGLKKLTYYLFVAYQPESWTMEYKHMESLCGLLSYYCVGMVSCSSSFMFYLFQSLRNKIPNSTKIRITVNAKYDLEWWRTIIYLLHQHPEILGARISHLDTNSAPEWFICTDSSTTTGGGGWLATSSTISAESLVDVFVLRWTDKELHEFEHLQELGCQNTGENLSQAADYLSPITPRVSINILEFASAVYALAKWGPLLRDSTVSFGTDNSATLSWLIRSRSRTEIADRLLKTYAFTCLAYGIHVSAYHVPGVLNVLADILSRDPAMSFEMCDTVLSTEMYSLSSDVFLDTIQSSFTTRRTRGVVARTIVMASIFRNNRYTTEEVLTLLSYLTISDVFEASDFAPASLRTRCLTLLGIGKGSGGVH